MPLPMQIELAMKLCQMDSDNERLPKLSAYCHDGNALSCNNVFFLVFFKDFLSNLNWLTTTSLMLLKPKTQDIATMGKRTMSNM